MSSVTLVENPVRSYSLPLVTAQEPREYVKDVINRDFENWRRLVESDYYALEINPAVNNEIIVRWRTRCYPPAGGLLELASYAAQANVYYDCLNWKQEDNEGNPVLLVTLTRRYQFIPYNVWR